MVLITSTTPWVCSRCLRAVYSPLRRPLRRPLSRRYYSNSADNSLDLDKTRNIGIIAHIDAGKTTTTERMLYYSGLTRRIGEVDEGSTVTDFLPAERARGITIQSAAITFNWPPLVVPEGGGPSLEDLKSKGLPRSATPHTINLIDTPGHADFTFEVLRSLRILDGAVCILDGVAGVEAQTEQVWSQASVYNIPRIVFVNKLDREGAAFGRTVKEVGARLGSWPAVCQIPWFDKDDGKFKGVGDVISLQGLQWEKAGDGKHVSMSSLSDLENLDGQFASEMKKARVALVELLSEYDDTMVECFLEHDEDHLAVKPLEILESLRRCLLETNSRVVPVFAGASFRNIGVQPLLDAIVNLLPGPKERPDPEVSIGSVKGSLQSFLEGKLVEDRENMTPAKRNAKKKSVSKYAEAQTALQKLEGCALAFKVVNDAKRGILVYIRVYSGVINRNASLFNTNLEVLERTSRMLKMYASDAVEVQSIPAGHIGVLVGLKHARTGDTLVAYTGNKKVPPEPLNALQLRPINVPPPVFFTSVEPHSLSEEKNVQDTLALLLREDPSLHVSQDEDSGQTLLSGMGELHLEIARDRLINDLKAKASMGKIEIGYRECISGTSSPVTRIFDKEIAGRRGKAGCTAEVKPLEPLMEGETREDLDDEDIIFSQEWESNRVTIKAPELATGSKVSEDLLPGHLTASIITNSLSMGCLAALARGPRHSFPLRNTDITLTFSLTQHVFGNETTPSALSAAARLATQSALREVASTASLMEPVMNVSISVHESSLGAVVHDISSSRGGHIVSLDDQSSVTSTDTEDRPVIDICRIYAPPDPYGASPSSLSPGTGHGSTNQSRTITAKVPLKEMVGYLKHLRSLTGGRGTFVMSIDKFEKMNAQREKAALAEIAGF
ncbi:hypothetical protein VTO42DRAFT_7503 [Malbranchea cinnamomea]